MPLSRILVVLMESIKELRKICQNPKEYHNPESFLDQKVWRSFSIYLTKLALYTPLKPDNVTAFMIFWGFLVGFLFSIGTYWYMLVGAIALEFLYVLDAIDGEMARYKKMSSLNGIFLDLVAHSINMAVPFVGLTVGIYRYNPSIYVIILGLLASVFSVFCLNVQPMKHHVLIRELIKRVQKKEQINLRSIPKEKTKGISKEIRLKLIGKMINSLYDQIYVMQIILFGAIFNQLQLVLFFYGITFPLMWLAKLVYEYKIGYKPYEHLLPPYRK